MKCSKVDRVHTDLYKLAEDIAKQNKIPRVQAYREIAEMIDKTKPEVARNEAKNFFKF